MQEKIIEKKKNLLQIPCEIWQRVVGFYRPLSEANKGKQSEIKDRKLFDVNMKNKEYDRWNKKKLDKF